MGRPWEDASSFLRVAIELAAALGHLHARGIVHRDIKPANVVVDIPKGKVWLSGFGIASRLPRERRPAEPPEVIAGTLAYMAPEQTGRMNRSVDSRSDLYSYGITLYEMLTGALPFDAPDPMGWVHCHIAEAKPPPISRARRQRRTAPNRGDCRQADGEVRQRPATRRRPVWRQTSEGVSLAGR